jgi:hypothetical protein
MILTGKIRRNLKKNLFLCHFVHIKFHIDRLGIESSELTGDNIKMNLNLRCVCVSWIQTGLACSTADFSEHNNELSNSIKGGNFLTS